MPGTSFEAVTGRLGVGAIALLGLFLMVDGLHVGAFEMLETYGKSTTWGIVGVVPAAVVISARRRLEYNGVLPRRQWRRQYRRAAHQFRARAFRSTRPGEVPKWS